MHAERFLTIANSTIQAKTLVQMLRVEGHWAFELCCCLRDRELEAPIIIIIIVGDGPSHTVEARCRKRLPDTRARRLWTSTKRVCAGSSK